MDLEVEMAGGRAGVPGAADVTDDLTDVDLVAALEGRGVNQVGVPVLPPLPQAPDDDVVAVEAWVVGALDDGAGDRRREGRAATAGDVEALMAPAAIAG